MRGMLVVLASALMAGCGEPLGSCVAFDGIVDVCKQDWTEAECQEWDELGVNGASWVFHGESCEDLGFGSTCADGTRVRTTGDC